MELVENKYFSIFEKKGRDLKSNGLVTTGTTYDEQRYLPSLTQNFLLNKSIVK